MYNMYCETTAKLCTCFTTDCKMQLIFSPFGLTLSKKNSKNDDKLKLYAPSHHIVII